MNIEKDAAARLLDKGIKVRVTAPLLLKLFGKRTINVVIRQPYLGTLYRISLLYLSMGLTDEQLTKLDDENIHQLITGHGKTLCRIAAQGILNGKRTGSLFGRLLANWLFWTINPVQLLTIVNILVSITGTTAFTNTIGLVRSMKMTHPNPSQPAEGS